MNVLSELKNRKETQ